MISYHHILAQLAQRLADDIGGTSSAGWVAFKVRIDAVDGQMVLSPNGEYEILDDNKRMCVQGRLHAGEIAFPLRLTFLP